MHRFPVVFSLGEFWSVKHCLHFQSSVLCRSWSKIVHFSSSRNYNKFIALLLPNSLSHNRHMYPKNCPGVCTWASQTSLRNVHTKIQIRSLIKRWILYIPLLLFKIPAGRERRTSNRYSLKHRCLFQRPKIQVNRYKRAKLSTKAEFFPRESILRFIHQ